MNKIYKELTKVKKISDDNEGTCFSDIIPAINPQNEKKRENELTSDEKSFLLAVERGDLATVKTYLEQEAFNAKKININCVDPLGRSALLLSIEYENIEMMELLLSYHVQVGEALLHAINEEFVEAVEILLAYQDQDNTTFELHNVQNEAKSSYNDNKTHTNDILTTQVNSSNSFTPDISPLILAAHKNNYEIIKILLDRGAKIPEPHDVRCNCEECYKARKEDSLCYSKSRLNAYKALASPSLISLSSKDPILTAFELSWDLRRLSKIENEFKDDYEKLALACQEYAGSLLAETRTSKELEIILNHDHDNLPNIVSNDKMNLSRLKLAIKYKQKKFVAHSHCQQLLVSMWYEGLPGFRRRNFFIKLIMITLLSIFYPVLCLLYLIIPNSKLGKVIRQPFIKFICHSASYITFLFLLILASQRIKSVINESDQDSSEKSKGEKRGPLPTPIECLILVYVAGFIWAEIKQLYQEGVEEYLSNWWNLLDFITNALYVITIVLRLTAYLIVSAENAAGKETAEYPRDLWDPWDPTLISEGLFAAANIFSSLKLVYMFIINPHLGPLQISLGRMIFDIMKFSVFIVLVVFSFACGLNQLYWYYANMKEQECIRSSKNELEECLLKIKYFSNLFETLQTLFWGTFGLIEKDRMEIHRKHTFTMFVGLLMFGTYCTIMIIILINMLIAMMSNSYEIIANQADEEWKFARSKLWISYFEGGCTLPAPFSLIPSPKSIYYFFKWIYKKLFYLRKQKQKQKRWLSIRKIMKKLSDREYKYQSVIKELVKRYIMKQQKRDRNSGVTEDDLNEIKQDISSLRFELLDIFKNNGYKTNSLKPNFANKIRRKGKLNLEKAISKNIFDNTVNTNIYDPFNMLQNTNSNDNTVDLILNNNNNDNNFGNSNNSSINNNIINTHNKNISTNANTPAMYKIACKLKKITEQKVNKKNEIENSSTTKASEHEVRFSSNKQQQTNEFNNSFEIEKDSKKICSKPAISTISDDTYTERITEV